MAASAASHPLSRRRGHTRERSLRREAQKHLFTFSTLLFSIHPFFWEEELLRDETIKTFSSKKKRSHQKDNIFFFTLKHVYFFFYYISLVTKKFIFLINKNFAYYDTQLFIILSEWQYNNALMTHYNRELA